MTKKCLYLFVTPISSSLIGLCSCSNDPFFSTKKLISITSTLADNSQININNLSNSNEINISEIGSDKSTPSSFNKFSLEFNKRSYLENQLKDVTVIFSIEHLSEHDSIKFNMSNVVNVNNEKLDFFVNETFLLYCSIFSNDDISQIKVSFLYN